MLSSGPTGLAVLLSLEVGQWGRVCFDLLLQASSPPLIRGGGGGVQAGLNSRAPPVCTDLLFAPPVAAAA